MIKILSGALVPSLATLVFNLLNFFIENYRLNPLPHPSDSTYDFSVGCIFAIFGIGVAATNPDHGRYLMTLAIILLLLLIFGEVLAPTFLYWNKFVIIWVFNVVSFTA
jgi:hypothetical protein